MNKVFSKILDIAEGFPRLTIGAFAVLLCVCLWGLPLSKLELDIYDVYDPNFQSSTDLTELKSFYNDRAQMLVSFSFPSRPTAGELCKLTRWARSIERHAGINSVTSLWSVRAPVVDADRVIYPKSLADPCGLNAQEIYHFTQKFSGSFFRHLLSASRNALVFDVSISSGVDDVSKVKEVMTQTQEFITSEKLSVDVTYLGMAAFRYYFRKILAQDSIYNLLILLIILLFMRLAYGTWVSGLYLALTLIGTTVILYGSLAYAGIPIDILTNNLFLMTAVAGTADFIFLSEAQLGGGYRKSFLDLIKPSFFTTLTTIVGFVSLNSSDFPIIRRFGNGAALGALAEWMMLFMFLPAFLKIIKKDGVWVDPSRAATFSWIRPLERVKLPKWILKISIVLMALSLPSFWYLNDQDSPVENLPSQHPLRTGYEEFKERFSWQGQVYLYFPEVPSAGSLSEIIKNINLDPLIYRIEEPMELAKEWSDGLPLLRRDLILRELSMSPLWERYYSNAGTLRIPLYLKEQDLHSLRSLRSTVLNACNGECRLAGQRVVYLEYGEKISKTMIESFGISLLMVLLVLALLLKSQGKLRFLIPVTMSALMGPLVTLTLISIFQVPVTLITSIFLAVMVGLAGDNAIHYLLASKDDIEAGIAERGRASIMVTIVMILGSSMFLFQSLMPMKILGLLFIIGFLVNLLGDLWGLKGLLKK